MFLLDPVSKSFKNLRSLSLAATSGAVEKLFSQRLVALPSGCIRRIAARRCFSQIQHHGTGVDCACLDARRRERHARLGKFSHRIRRRIFILARVALLVAADSGEMASHPRLGCVVRFHGVAFGGMGLVGDFVFPSH